MKPAVFLDRDGVITKEKSYIKSMEDLEIFPYAKKCIEMIHGKGYYAIVVTNQSAVARGLLEEKTLVQMNELLKQETEIDKVYYCPHHVEAVVMKYRKKCQCRKPNIGMILEAKRDFDIDMSKSIIVGDRASDIETGKRAGVKTILVNSGYGLKNLEYPVQPDYTVDDLTDVINYL